MQAPDTQLAVTLYNLRDFCKTESDLDRTLDKVCAIGYQAVQVSGVALDPKVIKKQLDKHNLFCCATHEGLGVLTGDLAPLIDKMQCLECDFTALGCPPQTYINSYAMTCELIDIMRKAGGELMQHGIKLGYHNHANEFRKHPETGKTMLQTFYERTAPGDGLPAVFAEIDVHWVTRGGGSPVRWIWNVNGRMPVVHFKDLAFFEGEPRICEVGEGNLDWPAIIDACRETNVRWYSVEQDTEWPNRDIFESIKISYDNLRAMGVR